MVFKITVTFTIVFLLGLNPADAQDKHPPGDSSKENHVSTETDTSKLERNGLHSDKQDLHKLNISGYVQAQYQRIDSAGADSFSGGSFDEGVNQRFMVRRGRIKFTYRAGNLSRYVMQFDVTEKGLGIKDMYARFYDPWTQALSLTAGVFNRPFGYEIAYSSSMREAPERSRIFQTLFPDERDVGVQLSIQGPEASGWNFLKVDLGMFNGNGPNPETDSKKDFIGHIGFNKASENARFKFDFGASYYKGGVLQSNDNIYQIENLSNPQFHALTISAPGMYRGKFAKREYTGIDAQLYLNYAIGSSSLKMEYIQGVQAGSASSSKSPKAKPSGDTYLREFKGGYINFVQGIYAVPLSLVAKYDWYDPNKNASGDDINSANRFGGADIKYATLGFGLLYQYDPNIRFTTYYDLVSNETTSNLAGYSQDFKDDVITFRIQYKF